MLGTRLPITPLCSNFTVPVLTQRYQPWHIKGRSESLAGTKAIFVEIILKSEIVDYILTICVVWLIMIGFFLILTREVMIIIGVVFPVLIIILINKRSRPAY
jgi:hypothetical protein